MSMPMPVRTIEFVNWYTNHVRPLLEEHLDEEKIRGYDKDLERLQKSRARMAEELAVCFLGNSGVGKSTLINAVAGGDRALVPSGGVGPLTAQAIEVCYGAQARLEVEYHGAGQLLRTLFGLEQMFRDDLGAHQETPEELDGAAELDECELPERGPDLDTDGDAHRNERRETLRRQAQLMVAGRQDDHRELRYLIDSLRAAAGGKRVWGTEADPRDEERIRGIRNALRSAKQRARHVVSENGGGQFGQSLKDHATGYLAPLIKSLQIHWNSTLLRDGITLVDLPGVGVMRDVHRAVTRRWIREKANALVLIVDHRGLYDSVAEALRESEFLNRLLYSADEPEDDPVVLVAVTRIDDIADSRYTQDHAKRKYLHFLEVAEEARHTIRDQARLSLESIWLSGSEVPAARRKVVENVLASLQVHPVSAPQFAKLLATDPDDPPFLRDPEQSGVPGFVRSLEGLARNRQAKAYSRLAADESLFRERIGGQLRLIQGQWESDARAEEEAARLREQLDIFMDPLRKELNVRQGAYRAFLKKTIPQRIEDLVEQASLKANIQFHKYLLRLGTAHWATLRASVTRGGRFKGATDINLPTEFALQYEEPIAELWGKQILRDIRRETKDYAADCVRLVEEVADWATQQGARVQPRQVDAQRDAIKADARKLDNVGHEMVREMRDEVKAKLIDRIEGPIKARCDGFIRSNRHVGTGVRQRILDLYSEMPEAIANAAKEPATRVLLELFKEVEQEILDTLGEHANPLDEIAEAIVSSQETFVRRSDAQKRRRVLGQIDAVWKAVPQESASAAAS